MDKVLKQRLVGASILIALAVIFLPMLFDNGDGADVEERELALDLPERDAGDRRVRRLALDPDQARQPPGESEAEPPPSEPRTETPRPVEEASRPEPVEREQGATGDDESPEPEAPRPAESEEVEEVEPLPEPEAQSAEGDDGQQTTPAETEPVREEPDESETVPSSSTDGGWAVQVAVFSNRETANSIRQRLEDLGHRAFMDVLIRDQAELFRLRTGPYQDEATAEQARGQIAATVAGVDPVTRELSNEAAAADRQGLSVQVGSFASRNNAERLVGQLSDAGFDAFMFGEDSGGRTIWRVRVGTHDERADAERLLEKLREEQGLEGIVVSHP
ncbi:MULTISPECIES: SPOR domain-containing protein [unclassified Wenzhouxiangella]|uniref:SPOR domain-containing protein n=1 Tax=unclassified Wenzhouxiangella TaxID=2613841 RepID=UPI000E32C69C|nr:MULTISPECIES: SPOR domain-containing protein [unclassified Wenzhouxiangella]RFF27632.1 SPOR domain-containing protein [Wenzhouxiangella sp. 15181]RFP70155.1 SPOR domain-containing protein [Wenzhouxiangella sp. 15190]